MEAMISLQGAGREYGERTRVRALHPTDLEIPAGELVVLLGPSGSGKTTLLNLIGGLDRPSEGQVRVDGIRIDTLGDRALGEFRRDHVSFVFQFFNLVPSLTAAENVALAAEIGGVKVDPVALLRMVGLLGLAERFPAELSGGQQQRVAVARALARRPPVLLCDEPTGALDRASGVEVLDLIDRTRRASGQTVVIVTHDPTVAERADRVVRLEDGRVMDVSLNGKA